MEDLREVAVCTGVRLNRLLLLIISIPDCAHGVGPCSASLSEKGDVALFVCMRQRLSFSIGSLSAGHRTFCWIPRCSAKPQMIGVTINEETGDTAPSSPTWCSAMETIVRSVWRTISHESS